MSTISELQKFCRNEFAEEARRDFFTLKRIPSTKVCRLLWYYTGLDPAKREAFSDAVAWRGAMNLIIGANLTEGLNDLDSPLKDNKAWKRWVDWSAVNDWRFPSVPERRLHAAQATIDRAKGNSAAPDIELDQLTSSARNVRAEELRKRVRRTFGEVFAATAVSRGGGWWLYEGNLNGSAISVSVDYAGRHTQLRYDVTIKSDSQHMKLEKISYESALGIGGGDWNLILKDNVDDTMRLLAEFVGYLSTLPRGLPSGWLVQHAE